MCTVIFLPTGNGPCFASCRDEDPARPKALRPKVFQGANGTMVYPEDAAAKGTWIGAHSNGHLLILLNGAFEKHERLSSYRKSRGLIVKEMLDTDEPLKMWTELDLTAVEPFTLVVWYKDNLSELVWDGIVKYDMELDNSRPAIWSSATLYDTVARKERQHLFTEACDHKLLTDAGSIYSFLQQHNDPDNGFVMKRHATIQTLSISLIELKADGFLFTYHDLVEEKNHSVLLQLNFLQA